MPPPLPSLPPVKNVARGKWTVHLERAALVETIAMDAEKTRKAGFQPYRVLESRTTSVIEYTVVFEFADASEAYNAARKIAAIGYRPEVRKQRGGGAKIEAAVVFSDGAAKEIVSSLESKGIRGGRIEKRDGHLRLQGLRMGPYNTEAEARDAAGKMRSAGFAEASAVMER